MSSSNRDCCECKLERDYIELAGGGGAYYYPVAGFDLSSFNASPYDNYPKVRGLPTGSFENNRPVSAVVHSDWCSHRPTKAVIGLLTDGLFTANGTARVFVEGDETFSKYVWAEIQYEANVAFPATDDRHHTLNGTVIQGGAYGRQVPLATSDTGPVFGTSNNQHVPAFRSQQDSDGYLTSPWPVYLPRFAGGEYSISAAHVYWFGLQCRLRWGYRVNNVDTILGSVVFPDNFSMVHNRPAEVGAIAIGCNWEDISFPNDNNNVRCGVELLYSGFSGFHGYFRNISEFGAFSIPFELPRSFFVDSNSDQTPTPPMQKRLVGLSATAPRVSVPVSYRQFGIDSPPHGFVYGQSTNVDVYTFSPLVSCGARRANVFVAPQFQSEDGVAPSAPVGPATIPQDGIIRETAPLFIRRDDLNEQSYNQVANGDSWHATHLVRFGSPLSGRNFLHNLNIGISPCTFPGGLFFFQPHYASASPIRAGLLAVKGSNFFTPHPIQRFNLGTVGTQFMIVFPEDISEAVDVNTLPDAWLWDAISGQHALTPYASSGERLVANAYHLFYDEPCVTSHAQIVTPQGYLGQGQNDQLDPTNVLQFRDARQNLVADQDAAFAEYESFAVPSRVADYRGEWTIETYPQLWATTRLFQSDLYGNEESVRVGPRQVPFADSGMTTENHDAYSGSGYRLDYVPENVGATVTVFGRVGVKTTLHKVQGFRRVRQRQQQGFFAPSFIATNQVAVYGDYSPGDVACDERVFSFDISLSGQDVQNISAGNTITKQLRAGYYSAYNEQTNESDQIDVFRTVTVGVSVV